MQSLASNDSALATFLLMLRARGLRDAAMLNAIERAPRERFLPLPYVGFAYQEIAVPIPCGQEATAPMAVLDAVMALRVRADSQVLEIGTGSGWQTALLAGLARAVASVERYATLAESARERLSALGIRNAIVVIGDGEGGLPAGAPFDRIIVNAALPGVSPILAAQLAEGGMLVAAITQGAARSLIRFIKRDGELTAERLGPSRLPPLAAGVASVL
ncbi:MAG: protein-L-isoaspartate(D-aspartate) O-methyltransferase [Methylocystis sp.]|nr:protein-L-isoaspartate(D-aspartate) O-methyltransferase [Methylocystis sp.]MCA3584039.1 protein-L-isoaspartate(D-aspartate) O-methyltransferase [Methylocystis sp.]MCA3586683.1 protein-L-isoaspartate(D-aspartate) O-methyltransferase [Methylocystis sp.]MCA3591653.1 protein-L-isoaspartate(D-aspartate) O-methyltransferase [Methylocystis sp.]